MEENNQNNFIKFLSIEQRTKYFVWVLFCLSVASVFTFATLLHDRNIEKNKANAPLAINFFETLSLEARGIVVWDVVNQRELFAKNPDLALPLASLAKVMTAVTANEIAQSEKNIKITAEDLTPEGDSKLVVGDSWNSKDLTDFTLLTSSNDGAYALASVAASLGFSATTDSHIAFIKKMNQIAETIGMSNSHFWNEHGLDRQIDQGGAYGSAKDMALLFQYTLTKYPHLLEATRYKSLAINSSNTKYDAENTNIFVNQIPGLLASKTGYTELAGGNLVIAFDAGLNRPIIISALGSSEQGRFDDVLELVDASMQFISN